MSAVRQSSPFTPGFGATPPTLAGRADLIDEFVEGLDGGPGSGERVTFYTGPRGIGKTVLLNALEVPARERGWVVVAETCSPGLTERLAAQRLPRGYEAIGDPDPRRRLSGISVGAVAGVTWDTASHSAPDLRGWVERITDILDERNSGLLITLDEIHPRHVAELVPLATVLQHAVREGRNIAFAGTALSTSRAALLEGTTTTFLRRAVWNEIGRIPSEESRRALHEPIRATGRQIGQDTLARAADVSQGYSFLIQLLGDFMWRNRPDSAAIDGEDLDAAVPRARRRMGKSVLAPELQDLSDIDRSYLLAMAEEGTPAGTRSIADRLGVDVKYASVYRRRLIDADVIHAAGHGLVDFVTPGMAEYLREHWDGEDIRAVYERGRRRRR